MTIQEILKETAETIRGIKYLTGVPVIEMEKGDVGRELDVAMGQQEFAVVVSSNGFTPIKQDRGVTIGKLAIVVEIFERPSVNRARKGAPTICTAAQVIAKTLDYSIAKGMDAPLYLKNISPLRELGSGAEGAVVTCDVTFENTTEL